jgi:hypothetical protein
LKDQQFSIFPDQNPRFEQQPEKAYAAFRAVPSRRAAAAPTKNIENNPMQSSRRPPQPAAWTENLTRRANQRHNMIIPEFAKRLRARNMDAIMFAGLKPDDLSASVGQSHMRPKVRRHRRCAPSPACGGGSGLGCFRIGILRGERAPTRRALRARRPKSELRSSRPRKRERRSEPDDRPCERHMRLPSPASGRGSAPSSGAQSNLISSCFRPSRTRRRRLR